MFLAVKFYLPTLTTTMEYEYSFIVIAMNFTHELKFGKSLKAGSSM